MSNRQELKDELKQDAKKAWDFIKKGAKKIGTYALLCLSLSSNTSSSEQLKEIQQNHHKQTQTSQNKLDDRLNKTSQTSLFYENYMNGFVEETSQQKAEKIYNDLVKDQVVAKELSFSELMEKTGITIEDIQNVFSKNQDRLKDLIPGKIGSALAKSADKVTGENEGGCLLGAQKIFGRAGIGEIICGSNPDWPQKIKGCSNNSACNAYIPLEKSGKFVNITLKNLAYNKPKSSQESQQLQKFCKTLPAGSVIITDNKMADEHQGRRYRELSQLYGTGGKLHGHIAIKDNHGLYKEEGVALAPSFHNYGKTFKVSLSTDYQVPKDLAIQLLEAKEKREKTELEQSLNSKNYVLQENKEDKTTLDLMWMRDINQSHS